MIMVLLNKRFINAKIGTIFNRTCLIEGLFPAYTNIYIYIYIYIILFTPALPLSGTNDRYI